MIKKNYHGFTIVEVLAAMAIMIIGIVTVLFLTTYNLTIENQSQKRLLASHLARESIEALRASRDSNWLAGDSAFSSWSSWYDKNFPAYNLTVQNNAFVFKSVPAADPSACGDACQVFKNQNESQPFLGVVAGAPTFFKRFFILKPICWDNDDQITVVVNSNQDCSAHDALAGYQVESIVAWELTGAWKQVNIIERLYDWR